MGLEHPPEAAVPVLLKDALHLLWGGVDGVAPGWLSSKAMPNMWLRALADDLVVVVFDLFFPLRRHVLLHGG